MVDRVRLDRTGAPQQRPLTRPRPGQPEKAFSNVLESAVREGRQVRFSAHALQRLQERGLTVGPEDHARLEKAVDLAQSKGCRESLMLFDSMALIVSVRNRTVITAVPGDEMGDAVFTNIDSAVVVAQAAPQDNNK